MGLFGLIVFLVMMMIPRAVWHRGCFIIDVVCYFRNAKTKEAITCIKTVWYHMSKTAISSFLSLRTFFYLASSTGNNNEERGRRSSDKRAAVCSDEYGMIPGNKKMNSACNE